MARIFKRKGCHRYHVEFSDTAGMTRRVLGFIDKNATEELGRIIDRAVAIRQSGGILAGDMLKWLETLKPAIRDNLAKWNVIDPQRAAAGREIADHINEWAEVMLAKGDTAKHVKEFRSMVTRLASGCKWRLFSEITAASAQRWLGNQRNGGMSIASSNAFVRAIKAFFNWLVSERRLHENPVAHLKMLNARTDRRRVRRALTIEEIGKLLAATEAGERHHGMTGPERSLLYRLALETGFRWSELRSLRKSSFDFSSEPATVTILPEDEKAGRGDTQTLRAELSADLKSHLSLCLPCVKVFTMWRFKGGEMLAEDLKAAGSKKVDDYGGIIDFHSLRHTFGSLLAAGGVHPKVAQDLMRHSSINLTMGIYTHTSLESRMSAIDKLPEIKAAEPGEKAEGETTA